MLIKIKQIWGEFRAIIIAAAVMVAYLIGKKRGKNDEKAKQNTAVLANISRADMARASLRDPDAVRRLHDKYKR